MFICLKKIIIGKKNPDFFHGGHSILSRKLILTNPPRWGFNMTYLEIFVFFPNIKILMSTQMGAGTHKHI